MVHSPEFVAEMRGVERDYRELSTELTLEQWEREPVRRTTLDGLARLTSALQ
jgi:cardiolipin synthase